MEQKQQAYIEQFGLAFEERGLGQTIGRIMGWLMICNPAQQTLDEICAALGMSKSTISTTLRIMSQFGMVERVSLRGDRKHYYQMSGGFWLQAIDRAVQQFVSFKKLAADGLKVMGDANPQERERLQSMYELHDFLEREFPAVVARWQTQYHATSADTESET